MPLFLFFGLRWIARRWLSTQPTSEVAAATTNISCFVQLSISARTYLAVAICLLSAVWGAVAIRRGWGSVSSIAFDVACPWFLSGSWLGGDFTRAGWKRLNIPLSRIYHDANERKLSRAPPLARLMNAGGGILVLAGVLGWFV